MVNISIVCFVLQIRSIFISNTTALFMAPCICALPYGYGTIRLVQYKGKLLRDIALLQDIQVYT